jgi:hypothetical protein
MALSGQAEITFGAVSSTHTVVYDGQRHHDDRDLYRTSCVRRCKGTWTATKK